MLRQLYRFWIKFLPLQLIVLVCAIGLVSGLTCALVLLLTRGGIEPLPPLSARQPQPPPAVTPAAVARVFTPEVQFWGPKLVEWSKQYNVDYNILATVIQIESCGDPQVVSSAGAQGLFQVMPFHFTQGENMTDPDVNAKRGIAYLKGGLIRADGHIGLAMAGYNGGWGIMAGGWAKWARETRAYYIWGSQIYLDAMRGKAPNESTGLQSWLNAGGVALCAQAAARQAVMTPTPASQVAQSTPVKTLAR